MSNVDTEVTVYSYANQALVGVLTGFQQPMGGCSDTSSNVYITDSAAQQIVEYAHGGSKPIKKLNDAPDYPYACSIDPITGNLAVANDDGSSQEGNIAIWPQGSGEPTRYTDSQVYNFENCAYDANGNLLANGYVDSGYQTYFAWLPRGGTQLANVIVPGPRGGWKWGHIDGVGWDGKYFTIDAYEIYRIVLTHGQAYYAGETTFQYPEGESESGPFAFYLTTPTTQATAAISGIANDDGGDSVTYWPYPGGGEPGAMITHGIDRPFAVTISLGKQ